MAENRWVRPIVYAALIAVAGVTYYLAQIGIDSHRVSLPVKAYLDCVQKLSTFDWAKVPGEQPSSSEVCKELATRVKR
jgi:hypothetical protein